MPTYETRISYEGSLVRLTTDDPDVIADVQQIPEARLVDVATGVQTYELTRNALAIHFPHLVGGTE